MAPTRAGAVALIAMSVLIVQTRGNATTDMDIHNFTSPSPTSAPSIGYLASKFLSFKIGVGIQRYVLPVVILLGVFGNTLSMIVMFQPHNRRISCCVYMGLLAISDNVNLIVLIYYWTQTDGYPQPWTLWACQTWVYLASTFTISGFFILTAMTVDRWIAVAFPLKARMLCTPRRACVTCLSLFIFTALYTLPKMFTASVVGGRTCATFVIKSTLTVALSYANMILVYLMPFIIVFLFNYLIIRAVRRSQEFRQGHAGTDAGKDATEGGHQKGAKNRQLTVMLLTVTFIYLLLTLPIALRIAIYFVLDKSATPHIYADYVLAVNATNKLAFSNSAVNFYLYCLGGPKFRQDLVKIFCAKKESEQRNMSQSQSITSVSTTA